MLLTRRAPDHVARPNFLFRAGLALHPPTSGRDDQGLPERMLVPRCPGAGLERDTDTQDARRSGCLEQWVNAYHAGKIFVRSFAGGQCTVSFEFHFCIPPLDSTYRFKPSADV